jgi:glycosyltransferase involved in cell wall biosynthesis
MPNTVLEAMACGLPIIASDIPAHRELIINGKNGLLVPVKNPKALADAIKLLIENKSLRNKLGEDNIRNRGQHSWERVFEDIQKINIEWEQKNLILDKTG